jgi:hypothetical protein
MSTRLAKGSARAVVASEQASARRANNFSCTLFSFRLQFTLLDVQQFLQITPSHFPFGEAQKP